MEWLAENRPEITFRALQRDELTPEINGWPDVVMMVRSDSQKELELARQWRKTGKYLIYIMDDDLLNVPKTCSSAAHYCLKEVSRTVRKIMEECHCLASPSIRLREKYGEWFERALHIEEPSTQNLWKKRNGSGIVKIGFAGSIDRIKDIDSILSESIRQVLAQYKDGVSFEFFGAQPKIADELGLVCHPYCDSYQEYQEKMHALDWDIALAPMPDTPFHACKHYNKFVEYAAHGIAGIYSNLPPYKDVILHEENGLLCENTAKSWQQAILRLIKDSELRHHISQNCSIQSRDVFSVAACASGLEKELAPILNHRAVSYAPIRIPILHKISYAARRIIYAWERYGLKMPVIITKKLLKIR